MPLPDGAADAVFVGDAFHWFDGPAAVAELARVLRPAGGVALLWNHWWSDGDDRTVNTLDPPLPAEAQALFDEVYVSSGRAAAARAGLADPLDAFAGWAVRAARRGGLRALGAALGQGGGSTSSSRSARSRRFRPPSARS